MTNSPDLLNNEFFSTERSQNVAYLHLKGNPLFISSDLSARDSVADYLDHVASDDSVKVIVMVNNPRTGREEYLEFYRDILSTESDRTRFFKMCNVFDFILIRMVATRKFVMAVDSGDVMGEMLNLSLAADYRIVSSDTRFQNAHFELGMIPKGGGAFLLPNLVGLANARRLLLSEKDLTARDAQEIGIVDEVVDEDDLLSHTDRRAKAFAALPSSTLCGTKKLVNFSLGEFKTYLDEENMELQRIFNSASFQNRLQR
ncbi:MAG: enoyl-CoA hydratase/isomerase family protein [Planctomycetota bacterium]|nr:enoyl-CoA hydratase/isomerase family protein [Planctomycetota bacterium]